LANLYSYNQPPERRVCEPRPFGGLAAAVDGLAGAFSERHQEQPVSATQLVGGVLDVPFSAVGDTMTAPLALWLTFTGYGQGTIPPQPTVMSPGPWSDTKTVSRDMPRQVPSDISR
jgi:hypothetical protein